MKLISSFKDYYDYLIGQYGIDEKVIYKRLPFPEEFYHTVNVSDMKHNFPYMFEFERYQKFPATHKYSVLFFCGRILYVRQKNEINSQLELVPMDELKKYNSILSRSRSGREPFDYNKKYPVVLELHSITMQPVILVNNWTNYRSEIKIEKNIPTLKDIKGFSSTFPALKTFLEITQLLTDMKDTEVIPPSTDTDKIVSHGFDKKISFRHRS